MLDAMAQIQTQFPGFCFENRVPDTDAWVHNESTRAKSLDRHIVKFAGSILGAPATYNDMDKDTETGDGAKDAEEEGAAASGMEVDTVAAGGAEDDAVGDGGGANVSEGEGAAASDMEVGTVAADDAEYDAVGAGDAEGNGDNAEPGCRSVQRTIRSDAKATTSLASQRSALARKCPNPQPRVASSHLVAANVLPPSPAVDDACSSLTGVEPEPGHEIQVESPINAIDFSFALDDGEHNAIAVKLVA